MSAGAAPQRLPASLEARLAAVEDEVRALARASLEQSVRLDGAAEALRGAGQQERLSLIVFSGSLDRLIAALKAA